MPSPPRPPACFGRWTVKLNLKAMYRDDSLVADATIDEYARPARKDGFWTMLPALSRQYFPARFHEMRGACRPTAMPLCIPWGERDAWLALDTAHGFHERIPNAHLPTVPDCGHNPHGGCPGRVNPVAVEFLAET